MSVCDEHWIIYKILVSDHCACPVLLIGTAKSNTIYMLDCACNLVH